MLVVVGEMSGSSSQEWAAEDSDGSGSDCSWVAPELVDNSDEENEEDESFDGWFDCEEEDPDAPKRKKDYHKLVGKVEAESRLGDLMCKNLLEDTWDATDVCEVAYYAKCIGARDGSLVGKLSRAPGVYIDPTITAIAKPC